MTARNLLIAIWKKNNGNWEDTYKDIFEKNYPEDTMVEDADKYITILDPEYPPKLKNTYKPPFVLVKE